MATRTGGLGIGVRQGWSAWQRDLNTYCKWVSQLGYEVVDVGGGATPADLATLASHNLRVGSADLIDIGKLLSPDPAVRAALVAKNIARVRELAPLGVKAFFAIALPDAATGTRAEHHALAIEVFTPICNAAAELGSAVALEGWPGPAPHYPALACTPESCRALLRDIGEGLGINFDPSHLVRLGIDPVRFAREFAPRIVHMHAKDTLLHPDAAYEFGMYQPAIFQKPHGFGEHVWRYTIPGHGVIPWSECLKVLVAAGYRGAISVELEDEDFNGSESGEKEALTHSLAFLRSV
jgi:sugar phosphate isomerase/epimerase